MSRLAKAPPIWRPLARVFGEQFEVRVGGAAPQPKSKEPGGVVSAAVLPPPAVATYRAAAQAPNPAALSAGAAPPAAPLPSAAPGQAVAEPAPQGPPEQKPAPEVPGSGAVVEPKGKGPFASDRVQNPHDPDATYAVKGQGQQKKEPVGYKVPVAETVCEATLAPGEPTRNFIVGMVTHPAYESAEAGSLKMEAEPAALGLEQPPVQYVDGAYLSAQKLVEAPAQGRELIGPAQPAPPKEGRFTGEDFQIDVAERTAICPAGKTHPQCRRLAEELGGTVSDRFEFSTPCHDCPLRERCLGKDQRHRTLVVGEHHPALPARRQEQQTPAFKQRMKHRNALEGTPSELVRGHGLRRARDRGLPKVKRQHYFMGAACKVKRWIRREAWKRQPAAAVLSDQVGTVPSN